MLLRTHNGRFLVLINLFVALNLSCKTDQPTTQAQTTHKTSRHSKHKKTVEPKVVEVSCDKKLQELLKAHSMVVIEYYSHACGSCTMFNKKYDELAKKHPNILFIKINGKEHSHLLKKHNIDAFPSFVFIFNNGHPTKTVVGAHKDSIEKGLQELITLSQAPVPTKSPASQTTVNALIKELTSLAELEELVKSTSKLVVVDYHAERWCGPCKHFGPLFSELASEHSDVAIFVKINTDHDQNQAIAKKYSIASFPTTLIFKDKNSAQVATTISGANKAGVKQAILQLAPAKAS